MSEEQQILRITSYNVCYTKLLRGEAGDEFRYSDIVAERFETEHHKIFIESSRNNFV